MSSYSSNVRFFRDRPDAVLPTKGSKAAVGFDVTALDAKMLNETMIMVDTHIIVIPPHGYWLQLVARSSLFKYNVEPVNGFGVIDPDYRGHIKFVLKKINLNEPFPDFPLRFGQLIPIKEAFVGGIETKELSSTTRGDGGFGSTG